MNAKEDLKKTYEKHLESSLSKEEAVAKTIEEVRKRHKKDEFEKALSEFLKELLPEEDPLLALADAIWLEYNLLYPKIKELFRRLGGGD